MIPAVTYSRRMDPYYTAWAARLAQAKREAKAARRISGDQDLAAGVSEILEQIGQPTVDRGAVNHWLHGRRQPNITQLLALCRVLEIDPAEILTGVPAAAMPRLRVIRTDNPLDELLGIARGMNERGVFELIGRARELALQHPMPAKANPAK